MSKELDGQIPEDGEIGDIWRDSLSIGGPWQARATRIIRKMVVERAAKYAHRCGFCMCPDRHLREAIEDFGIELWEWNRGNKTAPSFLLDEQPKQKRA